MRFFKFSGKAISKGFLACDSWGPEFGARRWPDYTAGLGEGRQRGLLLAFDRPTQFTSQRLQLILPRPPSGKWAVPPAPLLPAQIDLRLKDQLSSPGQDLGPGSRHRRGSS